MRAASLGLAAMNSSEPLNSWNDVANDISDGLVGRKTSSCVSALLWSALSG